MCIRDWRSDVCSADPKLAHLLHKTQQKKLNKKELSSAYERVLPVFASFRMRGPERNAGGGRRVPDASEAHIAGTCAALDGGGGQAADREAMAQHLQHAQLLLADGAVGGSAVQGQRVGGRLPLLRQRGGASGR